MNREILFRGKQKDNGEWVYGYYVCLNGSQHRIYTGYAETDCGEYFAEYLEVIPDTVGQYTGLTDKNGNKIFVGDIVIYQTDNDDCPFPNKDTKKRVGRIFFSEFRASYSVTAGRNGSNNMNNDLFKYVRNGNRVEVIGNIHDNPELLEG